MASIINSTTTSPGGLISTGDSSNSLLIQTGDTTAITINESQVVSLTNPLPVGSGGTGSNTGLTSLNASNLTSGTVPDARFPATLPATSGANLTSLNASSISSGTLAVARGGTGATSLTANNVLLGNGTSAVQVVAPGSSGNVLVSNGTTWISQAPSSSAALKYSLYTSGTTTFTAPAGVTSVYVICIGGGGGGGGGTCENGQLGGYGGLCTGIYTVTPGSNYTVTVGAGGNCSSGNNGSAGGTSSFGSLCSATGGGGGVSGGQSQATNGSGSNGVFSNFYIQSQTMPFVGTTQRPQNGGTTGLTWTATSGYVPGACGNRGTPAQPFSNSAGVGGIVFIQYVG